jgi:hypothetical protein
MDPRYLASPRRSPGSPRASESQGGEGVHQSCCDRSHWAASPPWARTASLTTPRWVQVDDDGVITVVGDVAGSRKAATSSLASREWRSWSTICSRCGRGRPQGIRIYGQAELVEPEGRPFPRRSAAHHAGGQLELADRERRDGRWRVLPPSHHLPRSRSRRVAVPGVATRRSGMPTPRHHTTRTDATGRGRAPWTGS